MTENETEKKVEEAPKLLDFGPLVDKDGLVDLNPYKEQIFKYPAEFPETMKSLDCGSRNMNCVPKALKRIFEFKGLVKLDLSNCCLKQLPPIDPAQSTLVELDLTANDFDDPSTLVPLFTIASLTNLALQACEELKSLPRFDPAQCGLVHLNIMYCFFDEFDTLRPLFLAPRLERLEFWGSECEEGPSFSPTKSNIKHISMGYKDSLAGLRKQLKRKMFLFLSKMPKLELLNDQYGPADIAKASKKGAKLDDDDDD